MIKASSWFRLTFPLGYGFHDTAVDCYIMNLNVNDLECTAEGQVIRVHGLSVDLPEKDADDDDPGEHDDDCDVDGDNQDDDDSDDAGDDNDDGDGDDDGYDRMRETFSRLQSRHPASLLDGC